MEAEIARLDCRRCGRVRTEEVPWARPGARATRDFEDVIAWLAQRMDKTSAEHLDPEFIAGYDRKQGRPDVGGYVDVLRD